MTWFHIRVNIDPRLQRESMTWKHANSPTVVYHGNTDDEYAQLNAQLKKQQ